MFLIIGKITALHITDVFLKGFGHLGREIEITSQEPWVEFMVHTQHVMSDQHLPIGTVTSPDPYDRNLKAFGYLGGQFCRYFLNDDRKATQLSLALTV